jgi:hypothetical protein
MGPAPWVTTAHIFWRRCKSTEIQLQLPRLLAQLLGGFALIHRVVDFCGTISDIIADAGRPGGYGRLLYRR